MRLSVIWSLIFLCGSVVGQRIESFRYSAYFGEKVSNAYETPEILAISDDSYQLIFAAFQNCVGEFETRVHFVNDSSLNLDIFPEGASENSETEIALCNCLFEFTYLIRETQGRSIQQIRVNGLPLEEYNQSFTNENNKIDSLVFEEDDLLISALDSVTARLDKKPLPSISIDSINSIVNNELHQRVTLSDPMVSSTIIIVFTISESGSALQNFLVKGINAEYDKRTLDIINELNLTWTPGEVNGVPVKAKAYLPIRVKPR